ncbi:hypothetical protein GOODEAATRI_026272 [Goodea atripinnis]|uniref:Uncharacterized protein n=1 Tax=Goodea atripinnis TaxID=208336 RepID=A0ABV0MMR8_9TELE
MTRGVPDDSEEEADSDTDDIDHTGGPKMFLQFVAKRCVFLSVCSDRGEQRGRLLRKLPEGEEGSGKLVPGVNPGRPDAALR